MTARAASVIGKMFDVGFAFGIKHPIHYIGRVCSLAIGVPQRQKMLDI